MSVGKVLAGYRVRLRPVEEDDAAFVVKQRRSPRAAPYLGKTSPDLNAQRTWIARQRLRTDDYYFLGEDRDSAPIGTIGLYNVDQGHAEWGRFVVCEGTPAAPAVLALLLAFAFETLGVEVLRCVTVADNARAINFYERAGFKEVSGLRNVVTIGSEVKPSVMHVMVRDAWPVDGAGLRTAAESRAGRLP